MIGKRTQKKKRRNLGTKALYGETTKKHYIVEVNKETVLSSFQPLLA